MIKRMYLCAQAVAYDCLCFVILCLILARPEDVLWHPNFWCWSQTTDVYNHYAYIHVFAIIYIYIYVCVHILRRYDIYIITHKNRFLADACWRQGSCSNSKSDVFLRLATPPLLLMHFPVLAMASLSIPWSPKLVRVGSGIWFSATKSRF